MTDLQRGGHKFWLEGWNEAKLTQLLELPADEGIVVWVDASRDELHIPWSQSIRVRAREEKSVSLHMPAVMYVRLGHGKAE
jgi:hypothetical protein